MLKKSKKLLSTLLSAIISISAISVTVSAADETASSTIPEGAVRHTVAFEVSPNSAEDVSLSELIEESEENGDLVNGDEVEPETPEDPDDPEEPMYGQSSCTLGSGNYGDSPEFYVGEPYFAFEAYATDSYGNACNGQFSADFRTSSGGSISTITGTANGTNYKNDWISIYSYRNYKIRMTNNSSYVIKVYVTYYSWS